MGTLSCVEWLGWAVLAPSLRGALATKQSIFRFLVLRDGLLRFARNDGKHAFTISRLDLPEACYRISLRSSQRAQGMPGARCTRGLVCKSVQKGAHEHTGSAEASDIPCAMVLRLISCSPRRTGLVVTVVSGIASTNLTPASGRQDHTTSPYASVTIVRRNISVHRIPSRACDDRETPLVSGRDQIDILLIWVWRQANFGKSEMLSDAGAVAWRPTWPKLAQQG
jgi:hypothetical protein